ncbi:hypothetical protein B0G69_5625 [Paraburkholderia sp. RAU2J]|uniref:hypothetical protein n=1 Tax=Paraburkholderia sp. RAU2J TaxID=1938810 RepID=UPI000F2CEF80|nr:hypothetical protein [Paraburkholderia sp. RAU2J]RKT22189.1 hypothetical protein B0G69_5625 [Paraburkholderia sp. RAU2J]
MTQTAARATSVFFGALIQIPNIGPTFLRSTLAVRLCSGYITRADVLETARQHLDSANLEDVQAAILERNGQVSLIRKTEPEHRQ